MKNLARENGQHFMMPQLVSYEMMSEEEVQKSHADDVSYQGSASD